MNLESILAIEFDAIPTHRISVWYIHLHVEVNIPYMDPMGYVIQEGFLNHRCLRPEGQGGVHHGTFKATCRREGEWHEDFNELLADPLNRRIAIEWDRVLNQLLPDHVDTLLRRIVSETW